MPIEINSVEYQCWHEVGHAVACLHFGGSVDFIELLEEGHPQGRAVARCTTTPEIRQNVCCGGFAAEFLLLRKKLLQEIDEREIAQILFKNSATDREMFHNRSLQDGESFTKEEDEAFMKRATDIVAPIFPPYFYGMQQIVAALVSQGRVEGPLIKSYLLIGGFVPTFTGA